MADAEPTSPPRPTRASDPDDDALVEALRAGCEQSYEERVRVQGGRMLTVARRLLRDSEDAPDATQEAFVSAFRSIGSFAGQARFSTWLHRIVVNEARKGELS